MPQPAATLNQQPDRKVDRKLIAAFACVYFFWGSTFLGIHFAVQHFAPPMVSGLRFLMAAPPVFLIAWMRGHRLRTSRTEL
jgi:drug/metabolite transporter (DMT)-like permease